jgi:hypothetical protein
MSERQPCPEVHDLIGLFGQDGTARRLGVHRASLWRYLRDGFPASVVESVRAIREEVPAPVSALPPNHKATGISTMVRGDGSIAAQWIKTQAKRESPEEALVRLAQELPSRVPVRKGKIQKPRRAETDGNLLAVYPLGDPHVGLLAWGQETGADFDLAICRDLMIRAMRDLVLRGPRARKALILNLGDFFHADNGANHTTKGDHTLDVDGRRAKVLQIGIAIMVALIDAALEHHEEVVADNRIGNHDGDTSLCLALILDAYYRNEPRVTVPPTITHRAYYEHGRNLIGVTHGDRAKGDSLGEIMAAEKPEAWGRTDHRVWYTGHVHHQAVKEYRGVRVESFRTLAARDSWHAAQGYVAGRDMHRITLHAEDGEVGREIVNVDSLLRRGRTSPKR